MKIKNKIRTSLAVASLTVFMGSSFVSASESAWQSLTPSLETGLSGSVQNCSPLTVANGSVATYPACTITCSSGYDLSGSSCVVHPSSSSGAWGGGSPTNTTVPTNTSISINAGVATSSVLSVILTLSATNATQMIVSNDAGFAGASWETYATNKAWTLTSGDGIKTVYVKFRDSNGSMSNAISDTIIVSESGTVALVVTSPSPTEGCSGGNLYNTSTGALCTNNSFAQGCSLGNLFNTSTGQACPSNVSQSGRVLGVSAFNFLKNLRLGSRGNDVTELQKVLIGAGLLNSQATGYFGNLTRSALIRWQSKNGLPSTGYFGPMSRDVLNKR